MLGGVSDGGLCDRLHGKRHSRSAVAALRYGSFGYKYAGMTEQSPAQRRTARIVGWLFVATFITSIAGLLLYDPVLSDSDYIVGGGAD